MKTPKKKTSSTTRGTHTMTATLLGARRAWGGAGSAGEKTGHRLPYEESVDLNIENRDS